MTNGIASSGAARKADIVDARPRGLVDWAAIPGKGRGVVALVDCVSGTEVERSPVIVVPADDLLEREAPLTVPDQYLLYWSEDEGRELCMGGGLLMFYNHSHEPNIAFQDGPEAETMSVITTRDVVAGEELTYDYGVPLWFVPTVADARQSLSR